MIRFIHGIVPLGIIVRMDTLVMGTQASDGDIRITDLSGGLIHIMAEDTRLLSEISVHALPAWELIM